MEPPRASGAASGLRAYYVAVSSADAKLPTLVQLLEALRAGARLAVAVACSSRDSVDAVAAALASCQGFNLAVLHADLEVHELEQQVAALKRRLQPPPPPPPPAAAAPRAADGLQQGLDQQQRQQQRQQQQQQQQRAPQQQAAGADEPAALTTPSTSASAAAAAAAAAGGPYNDAWELERPLALVTSDVCLKVLHRDLLPLGLPLLVQYDIPTTKDVLQRRLGAVFGSSKERGRRAGRLVLIDFVVAGELAAFRARERLTAGSTPVSEMPVHVPDVFA